jgi:DNA-binding SARP family transcriptional activator/ABC-type transport system substrate-binding protein/streptogramin lyase
MEFRLLGSLEVREGERVVHVGGAKQRALLAILLVHANEVVSRDRLIEELWGDRQPGSAGPSLDHQVSRLRKALEPAEILVTRSGGYVLEVDPEQIDTHRFERLLEESRRANAAGEPDKAASSLRKALALWRGDALADLAYESFARAEIERLEELRLTALEERIDADLELGRHRALVAELESLTAKHPLRERLRGQLMLALYRSGRQAEALRAYSDVRKRLVEELGLEPGQALQDLEQAILRHDPSLELAPALARAGQAPSRKRRPALLTSLALVLVAVAAAAGVVLAGGGTQSSHARPLAEPDSIALVAAKSGEVIGQARAVPSPAITAFGERALWNVSDTGELSKIDPETGEVIARLNTGVPVPCGLAAGRGSVWVTDCNSPTLVRIDPVQTVFADPIRLPKDPDIAGVEDATEEVAVGAGSVWVARGGFANPSWVERLDPETGLVRHRILIPQGGAQRLAFGDGALWVSGGIVDAGVPKLSKIDPRTNDVTPELTSFGNAFSSIAVGGGFVWGATSSDHAIWKIGEDGSLVGPVKLTAAAENLTYADGAVWAADGEAGTVVRIDPTTNETRSYALGHNLRSIAVRKGTIAVGVQPSGQDVTAGLRGRIVHVALGSNYLDWSSTDPAATQTAFNPYQVQFQYATCAKLFNYPDAPGAAGRRLVPEGAVSWPEVTDGGRTYTFRIRDGYRFSPPSNEPVTAESFRHAIERFLSPKMRRPWQGAVLQDVVGARAYNSGRAPHVAGVAAQGDTLVIRLTKPAGNLPARLALPFFCAVTARLPIVLHGLPYPIPSAGPYYLASRSANVVVLKPNPNYPGPRLRRLDAIVYQFNVDAGEAVAQVERGKIDYVREAKPALAPSTAVARAAGSRYRVTPENGTVGLALNARRQLFADARLRRAVAYALDRRTLVIGLGGDGIAVPTHHVLPPIFPAFDGAADHSLTADLRAARRLVGERHVHAVFAVGTDAAGVPYDPNLVKGVRDQLAAIGIDVTVLALPQSGSGQSVDWSARLARSDIAELGRDPSQAIDPVDYLALLPPYLPLADHKRLMRIATLATPRREAAAASFAAKLERDGLYLGIANFATPELVSKRLGCVIDQPVYPGVDLASLCLRSARD